MLVSRCRLSMLVGFRQHVMMRQQSCRAEFSLFACVDLAHTTNVRIRQQNSKDTTAGP